MTAEDAQTRELDILRERPAESLLAGILPIGLLLGFGAGHPAASHQTASLPPVAAKL